MTITVNADSVEELKYLAGMINGNSATAEEPMDAPVQEPEAAATSSCGATSDPMNDILSKLRSIEGVDSAKVVGEEEELEEEWANSTEHFDGEDREMEQPTGEIVDTSLRRYLGAKGSHVTVDEGSHTIEKMTESYKKFKGEDLLEEKETDSEEDEAETETDKKEDEKDKEQVTESIYISDLKKYAGLF